MNIVICGAGEVGRHAAAVLGEDGHDITIIDQAAGTLAAIEEIMDIRTLRGNGAQADVLREALVDQADLFIAATNIDEINLLCASVAKGVGVRRCIARVHHSAYFDQRGLPYGSHLGIDHLVCPEHVTAETIAQSLRNPGATAVERFARGFVEMQQFNVTADAKAVGKSLAQLRLPATARLAAIKRNGGAFIPAGESVVEAGDAVVLVGDPPAFESAQKLFTTGTTRRRHVAIMGGTSMGVWLCRALKSRHFAVKLFVADRARAEELAEKLEWVTVLCADLNDEAIIAEEHVHQADSFVALTSDDEHNILWAARAKSMGARSVVAVLQRTTYMHLLEHVGIDSAYSPRVTAVTQMRELIDDAPLRQLASLAAGVADVYQVRVGSTATILGTPLREVVFPESIIIAAIERREDVFVPGADDSINPGDRLVIAGPSGIGPDLKKVFGIE